MKHEWEQSATYRFRDICKKCSISKCTCRQCFNNPVYYISGNGDEQTGQTGEIPSCEEIKLNNLLK